MSKKLIDGKKKKRKKKRRKQRNKTLAEQLNIIKHPNVFNDSILVNPKVAKRALGLDLATRTGFALIEYQPNDLPKRPMPFLGQFDLQVGGWESTPMKFLRLKQFLNVILPDVLFFEDVKQAISPHKLHMASGIIRSVEMIGALKATLCLWAEEHEVPAHGFSITAIKRHATGRGVANKESMVLACNKKFGSDYDPEEYELTGSDNSADAAFVLDLGMETYCEGLK